MCLISLSLLALVLRPTAEVDPPDPERQDAQGLGCDTVYVSPVQLLSGETVRTITLSHLSKMKITLHLPQRGPCGRSQSNTFLFQYRVTNAECNSGYQSLLSGAIGAWRECSPAHSAFTGIRRKPGGWFGIGIFQDRLMFSDREGGMKNTDWALSLAVPLPKGEPENHGKWSDWQLGTLQWTASLLSETNHTVFEASGEGVLLEDTSSERRPLDVLGVFTGHDSSLATAAGGKIVMVVELERYTAVRQWLHSWARACVCVHVHVYVYVCVCARARVLGGGRAGGGQ